MMLTCTHLHGLTFFSNISSISAGVRFEISGIMKNEAMHMGAEIPAKKKQVLRAQLAPMGLSCSQQRLFWLHSPYTGRWC